MGRIWKWFSGKKRTIAGMYWGVAIPLQPVIWPEGAPEDIVKAITITGLVLTYLGLGHAASKIVGKK